jgi:hypothetical protein
MRFGRFASKKRVLEEANNKKNATKKKQNTHKLM